VEQCPLKIFFKKIFKNIKEKRNYSEDYIKRFFSDKEAREMNVGRYDNLQSIRPVNSSLRDDFDKVSKNDKLYLPALRRVDFQPKDINISEEKENKSKNRKREDVLRELEKNTVLLKNTSSDKKYVREKIEKFPPEWDELFEKGTFQDKSSAHEEEENAGEYSDSDRQRIEKIQEKYNRDYLGKLIKKDKDIISAISDACRGILNFIETVANHLSSVSEEKKIQNMTSMKGLVFDSVA